MIKLKGSHLGLGWALDSMTDLPKNTEIWKQRKCTGMEGCVKIEAESHLVTSWWVSGLWAAIRHWKEARGDSSYWLWRRQALLTLWFVPSSFFGCETISCFTQHNLGVLRYRGLKRWAQPSWHTLSARVTASCRQCVLFLSSLLQPNHCPYRTSKALSHSFIFPMPLLAQGIPCPPLPHEFWEG